MELRAEGTDIAPRYKRMIPGGERAESGGQLSRAGSGTLFLLADTDQLVVGAEEELTVRRDDA